MGKHEGSKKGSRLNAVWGSGKIGAAIVAVIAAGAFAAPAVASPGSPFGGSFTITQNSSMIVNVSGGSGPTYGAVSLSDVSWADSYCY
jgi:hypothetical protein